MENNSISLEPPSDILQVIPSSSLYRYYFSPQFKSIIVESNEPNINFNQPQQNDIINTSLDLNTSLIASNGNDKTNASINDLLEDSLNNPVELIQNPQTNNNLNYCISLNENDVIKLSEYVQKEKNCFPLVEKNDKDRRYKNINELLLQFDNISENISSYFSRPKAKIIKKKKIIKKGDNSTHQNHQVNNIDNYKEENNNFYNHKIKDEINYLGKKKENNYTESY